MVKAKKTRFLKSLRFKLFLILLLGITLSVVIVSYLEITTSKKELREDLNSQLHNLTSIIYTILENTMALGRKDEVMVHLKTLTDNNPFIDEIRLVDNKKKVKFVAEKEYYEAAQINRLSYPITAKPVCKKCHGNKRLIGFLEVGFDVSKEKERLSNELKRHLFGYWFLLTVILSYVFVTLERGVFRRLKRFEDAMDAVGRGDFQKQIPVEGEDELSLIAGTFNRMSQNISRINNSLNLFSTFTFLVYQQKTEEDVLNLTMDYINNIFPAYYAEISVKRDKEDIVRSRSSQGGGKGGYMEAIRIGNKEVGNIKVFSSKELTENELSLLKLMAMVVSRAIEKIRDYEQVTELQENLLHLERLSTAGVMLGSILHEVNNPLSGVVGFSELILHDPDDRDTVRSYAKNILEAANRISTTIDNMLKFLRKSGTEEKISVDMNEIVRVVLKLKEMDLRKKKIEVITRLSEEPIFISAIPNQIEQALLNIINNAEYAMYEANSKGTLQIETGIKNKRAVIVITDDGPGMSEEVLKNIFNFFFTTKPPGVGTGLGMSIVKRIIDSHNGQIKVESKVGQGTTFIISLPATANN